jgi:hypothetical protein
MENNNGWTESQSFKSHHGKKENLALLEEILS